MNEDLWRILDLLDEDLLQGLEGLLDSSFRRISLCADAWPFGGRPEVRWAILVLELRPKRLKR